MKLTILLLLFILFSFPAMSQCEMDIQKVFGTSIESRSTKPQLVGKVGRSGEMYFYLAEYLNQNTKEKSMKLCVTINRSTDKCLTAESKIEIKTNEAIVELKFAGKNECGNHLFTYAVLNTETVSFLKDKIIESIKVYYKSDFDDFSLEDNSYFFKTLKCFDKQ
jgi:hypothetical protein